MGKGVQSRQYCTEPWAVDTPRGQVPRARILGDVCKHLPGPPGPAHLIPQPSSPCLQPPRTPGAEDARVHGPRKSLTVKSQLLLGSVPNRGKRAEGVRPAVFSHPRAPASFQIFFIIAVSAIHIHNYPTIGCLLATVMGMEMSQLTVRKRLQWEGRPCKSTAPGPPSQGRMSRASTDPLAPPAGHPCYNTGQAS